MLGEPKYAIVDPLNIPTTEPADRKTFYTIDNGAAGNGNAIAALIGAAGIEIPAAAPATGNGWRMRRGRSNTGNTFAPANIISIAITAVVVVAAAAFIIWAVKKVI